MFLVATSLLTLPGSSLAAPMTREGVTFAEASDNVRLLNLTGSGWLDDPFVLVEEVTGDGDVVIEVDVHAIEFGSRVSTFHRVGFAITKVVQNHTRSPWYFFNIELERQLGSGSDYYDGLSFGQEAKVNRPFVSDRFKEVEDLIEPRDVLRFSQGVVAPGEQVSFRFSVTHNGPTPHFYLVQHTRREVSVLRPEGGRLYGAPFPNWETP
jgi:hypothetical protein